MCKLFKEVAVGDTIYRSFGARFEKMTVLSVKDNGAACIELVTDKRGQANPVFVFGYMSSDSNHLDDEETYFADRDEFIEYMTDIKNNIDDIINNI